MSASYAYLAGDVFLLIVWLVFFFLRKDLRRQQLIMSLVSAPLAPLSEILWFYKDYWRPPYLWPVEIIGVPVGVEEIIFAFAIGGIGSVIYQVVFRKTHERGGKNIVAILVVPLLCAFLFLGLKRAGLNTVWASIDTLLVAALAMVLINRQLLPAALGSAFFLFLLALPLYLFLFFFFPNAASLFWVPGGLSGIEILTIPIEELAWFAAWGAFSGVVYESLSGVRGYTRVRQTSNL